MATRTFTVPDLLDAKGRATARARVRAWRIDTHALVETETTDEYGQCTFDDLPTDVTCVLLAQWGSNKSRWFFAPVLSIEEGGTGASDAETAIENLEVKEAAILWAIVL